MDETLRVVSWTLGGLLAGTVAIFVFWRARSIVRVWRAPKRTLHSVQATIWRDPGDPASLDLAAGPGGRDHRPTPPFVFLEEHLTGSQPCVSVRDTRGLRWRVKFGDEVNAEALATRLAWAAGYFVEITYYLAEGRVDGATGLQRAGSCLDNEGRFRDARFELDEQGVIKHFDEHGWAWNDNPFVGTRELNGLKIVMMWLSNWDAKDVRDVARGSNTAIFEYPVRNGFREARYLIIDWGATFGRWGTIVRRGRWDCRAFDNESEAFVTGVDGEFIQFGYTGQRTSDIADGIRIGDARWLLERLDRLSEAQIFEAVRASGGTEEEAVIFSHALLVRLRRLREAVMQSADATVIRASAMR